MSSAEILWANRNIAVLARLHHVQGIRPVWSRHTEKVHRVTLAAGQRDVSGLVSVDDLLAAQKGVELAQARLVRHFSAMVSALENPGAPTD